MFSVYVTGQLDSRFNYTYSNGLDSVNMYDKFYFTIHFTYSGLTEAVFVVYKEGNIVNTSSNPAVRLNIYYNNSFGFLFFDVYSVTESDIGVYEIKWVSGGFSWFTAINVRGQNYRSFV